PASCRRSMFETRDVSECHALERSEILQRLPPAWPLRRVAGCQIQIILPTLWRTYREFVRKSPLQGIAQTERGALRISASRFGADTRIDAKLRDPVGVRGWSPQVAPFAPATSRCFGANSRPPASILRVPGGHLATWRGHQIRQGR